MSEIILATFFVADANLKGNMASAGWRFFSPQG
jgi:hypothetical protein